MPWQILFLAAAITAQSPPEDLLVLNPKDGELPANKLFYASLQNQAFAALDRRTAAFEELKSVDQIEAYQRRLKDLFTRQLGGFPERTPLNARTLGKLPLRGYTIEKVIFESQPGHHVTANFYLPDGPGPFPAVLVSSGHSRPGKAAGYNQRFGIAMAINGMAALVYDPIGQGERSQILTPEGQPKFSGTTTEHFLIGVGSTLVGGNTARFRVWDAMRAIDYACSRPEIDATRIGFTGCSGGGTLTSYVMALDERVACAAPSCYLTTFRRLLETIGPQDAEQNIFGQLQVGLDQPDYVLLRAPRPTLFSSTTNDFFDIQGTWDNFRQAKRLYGRLGFPERVDLAEFEGRHGVQPGNLLAITHWMRRWLVGKDDVQGLDSLEVLPEAELLCTPGGQVLKLPGARSAFELNVEAEKRLAQERQVFWDKTPLDQARATVRSLAGIRPLADIPAARMDEAGRIDREGYHIDKLVLHPDSGVPLPGLTYHPALPGRDVYLYLHEDGKTADGAKGGPIEQLVLQGKVVVALDLRGIGETASGKPDAILGDWKHFYMAYLLGQSLVGLHAEDAMVGAKFVAHYKTANPRKVHLVAVGRTCVPALHAAALEPDLFASVTLKRPLASWTEVVANPAPAGLLTSSIHAALTKYDLPDLVKLIDPAKLKIEP